MHIRMRGFVLGIVIAAVISQPVAMAAVFRVDVNGQLLGADDVIVGTERYNVSFKDGTFHTVYDNAPSPAKSDKSATEFSQALLDQVFIDTAAGDFDSRPELTSGCDYFDFCLVATPFYFVDDTLVAAVGAENHLVEAEDRVFLWQPSRLQAPLETTRSWLGHNGNLPSQQGPSYRFPLLSF